jgi:hypothetical protein
MLVWMAASSACDTSSGSVPKLKVGRALGGADVGADVEAGVQLPAQTISRTIARIAKAGFFIKPFL